MKVEPEYIAWGDVETDGIDARNNKLIQVAFLVTDMELNLVDEEGYCQEIYYSEEQVNFMRNTAGPYVANMHTENGLWDRLPSGKPMEDVDNELHSYLAQFFGAKGGYLGGNSITLDRNFLEANLPKSFEQIHYRSIDVSSFGILAKSWYNGLEYPKRYTHDARDDIRESLEQLKFLRKTMFR